MSIAFMQTGLCDMPGTGAEKVAAPGWRIEQQLFF